MSTEPPPTLEAIESALSSEWDAWDVVTRVQTRWLVTEVKRLRAEAGTGAADMLAEVLALLDSTGHTKAHDLIETRLSKTSESDD